MLAFQVHVLDLYWPVKLNMHFDLIVLVQGTMKIFPGEGSHAPAHEISGSGHHGIDYVGVASVRSGKGMRMGSMQDTNVVKIM